MDERGDYAELEQGGAVPTLTQMVIFGLCALALLVFAFCGFVIDFCLEMDKMN
jgi:hypothetical protein